MKPFSLLPLLACLLLFSSCFKTLARVMGHYKTPKVEANEKITVFHEAENARFTASFRVKSNEALRNLPEEARSIPMVNVYNAQRQLLIQSGTPDSSKCDWKTFSALEADTLLPPISQDSQNFDRFMESMELLAGNPAGDSEFDYFVLVGWVKFLPKMAKDSFVDASKLLNLNDKRICVYLLNFDFREKVEM